MRSVTTLLAWGLAVFQAAPASASPHVRKGSIVNIGARELPMEKYFNEPGGSLELGHYDKRYFKQAVPYDEHRVVLRDLIRSYLTTLEKYGAETWLAHGTLLGWWWNGQIMPWDYDLDVQISNYTMQWLGDNLNRTEHSYNYTDPETDKLIVKKYLLDINPHHVELDRSESNNKNIIDARYIDMQNGMFIDITGVREREPDRPGVWSCKNKHRYASYDIWPLRVTEFEGVKANIPYSFESILTNEYGPKSLVVEEWLSHRWDRDIKEWIMMDPQEERKRKEEAKAHKKQELLDRAKSSHD